MQVVKIYGVQDRRSTAEAKLPWVVRYTIDGRHRSKSFRTRIEADRYRGRLLQAVQDGGRFDETSGEPDAWQTPLADLAVNEWARCWLAEQWPEWQPRTRASAVEALARFTTIAIRGGATPPEELRVYLYTALAPGSESGWNVTLKRWMGKHCLALGELDRERIADIDRKLALKLDRGADGCEHRHPDPYRCPRLHSLGDRRRRGDRRRVAAAVEVAGTPQGAAYEAKC